MATLTIPAGYLEDARTAALVEITSDSDALRTADSQDRGMSAVILQRSLRLLDPLLDATGEVQLSSEQDNTSSPLVHMLEALARLLVERLHTATQYAPIPMGDVLDLCAQLRWAAEEAIRIDRSSSTDCRRASGESSETMRSTQTMLVEYLLEQARWRDEKSAEWPDDSRNARSAQALLGAAREVDEMPEDDSRLAQLDGLQRPYGLDVFTPGEDAKRLISRHGFDTAAPASTGALLEAVVDAEVRSSTENVDDELRWHRMTNEGGT